MNYGTLQRVSIDESIFNMRIIKVILTLIIAAILLPNLALADGLATTYPSLVGSPPKWQLEQNQQFYSIVLDDAGGFHIFPQYYKRCTSPSGDIIDVLNSEIQPGITGPTIMNQVFSGFINSDSSITGLWMSCAGNPQKLGAFKSPYFYPRTAHLSYSANGSQIFGLLDVPDNTNLTPTGLIFDLVSALKI